MTVTTIPCRNCHRLVLSGTSSYDAESEKFCSLECFWSTELKGAEKDGARKRRGRVITRWTEDLEGGMRVEVPEEGDEVTESSVSNAMFELFGVNGWAKC
mmetsp:Transcript_5529/g.14441  ORF Transcript_5529/g.14441 Transcript_5529/m.14441 type:complete len:100 (-) Transcript_5529:120-419(-)